MQDERFEVKYVTVNNCFVYLPEQWLKKLSSKSNVLRVRHKDVDYYLSWHARPSPDSAKLCLSATFARSLNVRENDEVFVTCAEAAPALASVVVQPKSSQDREIVELQSENIQSNLLDQISVVAKSQAIVAWVSKHLSVTLTVTSLNPAFKYGRLEDLTEIHVGDAATKPPPPPKVTLPKPLSGMTELLQASLQSNAKTSRIYRAHPLPKLEPLTFLASSASEEGLRSPYRVYASASQLPFEGGARLCRLRKVREERQRVKFGRRADESRSFVVLACPTETSLSELPAGVDRAHFSSFARHPCVFVGADLLRDLRTKVGGKLVLETVSDEANEACSRVELFAHHERLVTADSFRDYVARNSRHEKMLLNSRGTVSFGDGTRCAVRLFPEACEYAFFDQAAARAVEVSIGDAASIEDQRPVDDPSEGASTESVAKEALRAVVDECKSALTLGLGLHNTARLGHDRENILISGATGSGKTSVCELLREILSGQPYFVHTSFVDCRALKGKKVDAVQKLLATEISQAVYHQPSILFLDDIESVTSAATNNDEITPDSTNAARITDAIYNTISEFQATNYISVVASCTDVAKVGKKLREARGVHFFRTIVAIANLEKPDRIKILRSSLHGKLYPSKEIDWEHYGNKTEGWVAQDLAVLADKAAFAAWKRHVREKSQGAPTLRDADLRATLSRCTPMSLHGVSLYRGAGHSWSDVGGLADVKHALVEILHWPLKYPEIFEGAPIKLQSGILLYGMPGTGKTMLAGAIAKECGLNLISVKGPELLSKYIGASEESVRNVFEKAKRARPCVLFFDEFDSLAPRRGHDSTGVTDRVVNQLLTHLDGIEGREGVAVVAASSRPDLLDPALLRPGRLDKSLLCPLPDEAEREEILNAVCEMHKLDAQNLDLKAVARVTDGFTGADLKAILMQARLNVLEEAMDEASLENRRNYSEKPVTQKHLLDSVKSTKPSLPPSEKNKYNRIYAKFARSESYPIDELKHQKATLA